MRRFLERHARNVGLIGPFSPWWLVRYYLYRYGHGSAYVILGLACFASLAVVVHVQGKQQDTADSLAALVKNIQLDRANSTDAICGAQNAVTLKLRLLIVNGTKQSRPFEKLLRQFGAPPYRERLRMARRQARSIPVLDCAEFVERIRALTPPPPGVP